VIPAFGELTILATSTFASVLWRENNCQKKGKTSESHLLRRMH